MAKWPTIAITHHGKTELVILLRPVVIKDASLDGDYATLKGYLPGDNFFAQPNEAQPFNVVPSR